eukprot:3704228-Pleurochrysis_carterae.AAC.1
MTPQSLSTVYAVAVYLCRSCVQEDPPLRFCMLLLLLARKHTRGPTTVPMGEVLPACQGYLLYMGLSMTSSASQTSFKRHHHLAATLGTRARLRVCMW